MIWYALTDSPMEIRGLAVKEHGKFWRLPENLIDQVNDRVTWLARNTAGGRVRFRTDSPTVTIRWVVGMLALASPNMSFIAKSGIDVYVDGIFRGGRSEQYEKMPLQKTVRKQAKMQDVELYLPMYNDLISLEIGVEDGARVEKARPYVLDTPIVFYGSSITQGAAASRPGMGYAAQVTRALDADWINLGFAGAARGEQNMADYVAGLKMSLLVLDYDHNAPTAEHLENTHYNFYKTVRNAQPALPILMMTKPDFDGDYADDAQKDNIRRRDIVRATFERALSEGDGKVAFLDGERFFGGENRDACTADTCHPNDLGFYRMAQLVEPALRELLTR